MDEGKYSARGGEICCWIYERSNYCSLQTAALSCKVQQEPDEFWISHIEWLPHISGCYWWTEGSRLTFAVPVRLLQTVWWCNIIIFCDWIFHVIFLCTQFGLNCVFVSVSLNFVVFFGHIMLSLCPEGGLQQPNGALSDDAWTIKSLISIVSSSSNAILNKKKKDQLAVRYLCRQISLLCWMFVQLFGVFSLVPFRKFTATELHPGSVPQFGHFVRSLCSKLFIDAK